MSELGDALSKLVQLKRITDGDLGADPPAGDYETLDDFLQFFGKKAILMPLDHNSHLFKAI